MNYFLIIVVNININSRTFIFSCTVCESLFNTVMDLEHHKEELEHWSDDDELDPWSDDEDHNEVQQAHIYTKQARNLGTSFKWDTKAFADRWVSEWVNECVDQE